VFLSSGRGATARLELTDQRTRTDAAVARFKQLARAERVRLAGTEALIRRIDGVIAKLDGLGALRKRIDSGILNPIGAVEAYTESVSPAFLIYGSLSTLDDEGIAKEGRALVALSQAREVLAQEDALLAGLLSNGRMTIDNLQWFIQLVGTQRHLRAE